MNQNLHSAIIERTTRNVSSYQAQVSSLDDKPPYPPDSPKQNPSSQISLSLSRPSPLPRPLFFRHYHNLVGDERHLPCLEGFSHVVPTLPAAEEEATEEEAESMSKAVSIIPQPTHYNK